MSEEANPTPALGAGNVVIRLLGPTGVPESFTLVPSYAAARLISTQYGGLMKAMQAVVAGDVDAVVNIISMGLGYGAAENRAPPDLTERVWRTGISDESDGRLGERAVLFLRVLMGGGRLPPEGGAGAARP